MKKLRLLLIVILTALILISIPHPKPVFASTELLNYNGNLASEGDVYTAEFTIPAGEKTITVTLTSPDSNNFDLYLSPFTLSSPGTDPDVTNWDYSSTNGDSSEQIIVDDSDAGESNLADNVIYSVGVKAETGTGDFNVVVTSSDGLYDGSFKLNQTYTDTASNANSLNIGIDSPDDANAAVVIYTYVGTSGLHITNVTDTGYDSYDFACSAETTDGSVDGTNKKFIEVWTSTHPNVSGNAIIADLSGTAVEIGGSFTSLSGADNTDPFLETYCSSTDYAGDFGDFAYMNTITDDSTILIGAGTQAAVGGTVERSQNIGGFGTTQNAADLGNISMDNGDMRVGANWATWTPTYDFSDSDAEDLMAGVNITSVNTSGSDPYFDTPDVYPDTTTGPVTHWAGWLYDDTTASSIKYSLDGEDPAFMDIYHYEGNRIYGAHDFSDLTAGDHTIIIYGYDNEGNETQLQYDFTTELVGPSFDSFLHQPDDYGDTQRPGHFSIDGIASDDDGVAYVDEATDNLTDWHGMWNTDQTETTLHFFTDWDLPSGDHTIRLRAVDMLGNISYHDFNITVDAEAPVCTGMAHLGKYIFQDQLTYTGIHCTDNVSITNAHFFAYHGGFGTQSEGDVNPVSGSIGDNDLTFDFTTDPIIDGGYYVGFRVTDEAGNYTEPNDNLVVETHDDSNPTLYMDPILPTETMNTKPFISGSCQDTQEFDTNSYISKVLYQLDGQYGYDDNDDTWQPMTVTTGTLGSSYSVSYNYQYPTDISEGEHTLYVRCFDATNHATDASSTFTIIPQDDSTPPVVTTVNESFDNTNNYDDGRSSGVIWGNGKLRLKENITMDQTIIDSTDNGIQAVADPDGVTVWYVTDGTIKHYNPNTDTVVKTYTTSDLGVGHFYSVVPVLNSGTTYLWVNASTLTFVNTSTDQHVGLMYGSIAGIFPDTRSGNLNIWALMPYSGEVRYLDTHNTMFDAGDDTETSYDSYGSYITIHPMTGAGNTNYMVAATYTSGLDKWDDNGTPDNLTDDTKIHYDGLNAFFGLTDDGHDNIYYAVTFGPVGKVGVVTDGGTPMDLSDDTNLELGTHGDKLRTESPGWITFIPGHDGIGDQLLAYANDSTLIYVNTNSTPLDKNDDTFIFFDVSDGNTSVSSVPAVVNYNTLYVSKNTSSLVKLDLHRGFVTSGDAIATSTPPVDHLYTNNIMISDIQELPAIDYGGGASSITYSVSVDGGTTWQAITPDEVAQLDNHDYRIKVKISFSSAGHKTNVLGSYKLTFGGYTTEEQLFSQNLEIIPDGTTVNEDSQFGISAQVVDDLEYRVSDFSGTADLTLVDFNSNEPVDGLNVDNLPIEDGYGQVLSAAIDRPGEYKLVATSGDLTAESPKITVLAADVPISSSGSSSSAGSNNNISNGGSSSASSSTSSSTTSAGADDDNDGLTNSFEEKYGNSQHPLDPTKDDSDGNGIKDGDEDFDNDGLTNLQEQEKGTDPTNSDTDHDGIPDGVDPDPLNAKETPTSNSVIGASIFDNIFGSGSIVANALNNTVGKAVEILKQASVDTTPKALVVSSVAVFTAGVLAYPEAIAYPRVVLAFLWFRRKKRTPWGVVYEKSNRKAVPFATVRIYSGETLVKQTVTDLNGKYDMEVDPGSYTIKVSAGGFTEVTQGVKVDSSETVNQDIALSRVGEGGLFRTIRINFHTISAVVFYIGLVFSIISVILTPILVNFLILALFLAQVVAYRLIAGRKGGEIYDDVTNAGIAGAFVRVYNRTQQQQVDVSITDAKGRYSIRLPAGDYLIRVEAPGYVFPSRRLGQKVETLASGLEFMPLDIYEEQKVDLQIALDKANGTTTSTDSSNPFA